MRLFSRCISLCKHVPHFKRMYTIEKEIGNPLRKQIQRNQSYGIKDFTVVTIKKSCLINFFKNAIGISATINKHDTCRPQHCGKVRLKMIYPECSE